MPLHIATNKTSLVWHGAFWVRHSLALVNRELTLALLDKPEFASRFGLSLEHWETPNFEPTEDARFAALSSRMGTLADEPAVTVRHRWPPEFAAPKSGHLVLIQPWEFGSLPKQWVSAIDRTVDEVWVPSNFVRETYLASGVPGEKVVVVPNGVNTAHFNPQIAPFDFGSHPLTRHLRPETFKFLFVGGTIARKGIDVLLDAYDRAFNANDDVVLIIKDFGANSFYANQGMATLIQALQKKPGGAKIIYLNGDMTEAEIAGLYAACDCLTLPYRGEGYGLPIAEAMACGKPTVVTDFGAALDFANPTNAYLVPATVKNLPEKHISGMETVEYPFWAEPSRDALIETLRGIVSNRDAAQRIGAQAAQDIANKHTWAHAADVAFARLNALTDKPKTRTTPARNENVALGGGLSINNLGLGGLRITTSSTPTGQINDDYERRKQEALTFTRNADWEKSKPALDACLTERPNDWDVLNALAIVHYRTGDVDKAVELLRRGIANAANARDFHHNIAFILTESGQFDKALDDALAALHYSPENAQIRRTVERCRDGVLQAARKILRSFPDRDREKGKRDPEYRRLMERFHLAGTRLGVGESDSVASEMPSAPAKNDKPKLSLCMIVKNEERFLRGCLESVKGIVDEIVIVDTGSTDSTLDIAREYGAKIVPHVWTDDFSEARNVSLANATGNWALWMDADEELAPESREILRQAIETAPANIGGYMVMFRNWLTVPERRPGTEMAIHHACRVFRRVPGVRFVGRIHEQNLRSLQELGYTYAKQEGLILDHFGYAGEIMSGRNKHERFIRMLHREVDENPMEEFRTFHLFNLGNAYFTFGDMDNAAKYLALAAENADPLEEYTVTMLMELATAYHRLNRSQEGLRVCEDADKIGVRHAGIEFARGYCLLHLLRYTDAENAFKTALRMGEQKEGVFAQTGDAGAGTFKARYGLGLALVGQDRYAESVVPLEQCLSEQAGMIEARYLLTIVYTRLERTADAIRELRTCLEWRPQFPEAERDLGTLLFNAGEWGAALSALRNTAERNRMDYEAQARLATACEHLGLMDEAREVYERLRMMRPQSAEICVNLGRVLAAQGEHSQAIDAFADAMQLNPKYDNAYFNAGDLLYQMGYYQEAADVYADGLAVNPNHASGFFMLGNCYFRIEAFEAAAASYRQALVQKPELNDARSNLEMVEQMLLQKAA
jgi:tetratricopeptide (TPR) repeat protein